MSKENINLPKTAFSMKANLQNKEPEILKYWEDNVGKKYYPVRGKSISGLINRIKLCSHIKVTLGSCFIEKINETILISKEN